MGECISKRRRARERHVETEESPGGVSSGNSTQGVTSYDSKLEISYDKQETDLLSFRQWHRRMQNEHDVKFASISSPPKFSIWRWCNCLCVPCRYIESIDYNKKLCIYFLRFRTFKTWATGIIIANFVYVILYLALREDILPGGTYFYLLVMFVAAFLVGNILFSYGIPGTIGQIVVGIVFANLPFDVDQQKIIHAMEYSEKCMLVVIVIRAALLLDFGHLYGHFRVIGQLAFIPYSVEFVIIFLCGHYLMELPWAWSALQGVLVAPVSLAATISTLDKSRKFVFSENSKIPTVIIAVGSIQIIITIYVYGLLIAVIFSKGIPWKLTWWSILLAIIIQLVGGTVIGVILGCLAGMFPDRRSFGAPYCRIMFIGTGTTALILGFHSLGMSGVGVLCSSTMVVIASNIWEELGWHESSNPVLYFYSLMYFFAQPVAVSLVGFSMKFQEMSFDKVGIYIGTILLGTTVRELLCLAILQEHTLGAKKSEKIFLLICWIPKGAAEALLAGILSNLVRENYEYVSDSSYTLDELLEFVKTILHTTIFGMLITGPISSALTTFLTPKLANM